MSDPWRLAGGPRRGAFLPCSQLPPGAFLLVLLREYRASFGIIRGTHADVEISADREDR